MRLEDAISITPYILSVSECAGNTANLIHKASGRRNLGSQLHISL